MADAPGERTLREQCRRTAQSLVAARRAEDLWAAVDGVRQHFRRCPVCSDGFRYLARAVLAAGDEISCAECRARWPYLSEEKGGPISPREVQAARQHLAACPACADGYARFQSIVRLDDHGRLAEPEHFPRFDLSFLDRHVWQPAPECALEAARQLAGGIALHVRVLRDGSAALFEGLAAWLAPQAGPAYAGVRGKRGAGHRLVSLPDPEADVRITLAVHSSRRGKANLSIEVREMASERPLSQVQVTLRSAAGREVVDAKDGKATLTELAPDAYIVEIRCAAARNGKGLWRLPITIEAA